MCNDEKYVILLSDIGIVEFGTLFVKCLKWYKSYRIGKDMLVCNDEIECYSWVLIFKIQLVKVYEKECNDLWHGKTQRDCVNVIKCV